MKINNLISRQIWEDRYKKECDSNESDNIARVAMHCGNNDKEVEEFKNIMENRLFFPAGRTMSNSGIGKDLTLNNCFISPQIQDDLRNIFDKVKLGSLTHQKGGGIGYDFSQIRPKGSPTSNDAVASGAVSFMDVFNAQTATILQGGRRGANMGVCNIYNMDIEDFIDAKSYDEGKLVHFNVSVMVDNDFMNAVKNNKNTYLHYPVYDDEGKVLKDESKWIYRKEVNAKVLWDKIMKKSYDNGEPGIFFYENLNNDNTISYIENIVCSNPCAEYLGGTLYGVNPITKGKLNRDEYGGACNLGSIFLHNFVENPFTSKAELNYSKLSESINTAVKFLDNIIDINSFPDKIYENYQKNLRTIGLGLTGLGDMLCMLNMKYGSQESIDFIDNLMNFFSKETYKASIELAKEKGSFPFLIRDKFIESGFIKKHIEKDSEWLTIAHDILKYGIRNAKMLSVAPTGTLSLSYGENCSSGLEPIFSLEYERKVKIGGQSDDDIQIVPMRDYAYEKWLEIKDKKDCIVDKDIFTTALELTVQEHLDVLSTIAYHIDMSCSKTINIPTEYSFEDTKKVYEYCWEHGVKGCTIFRPNEIRQGIFITEDKNKQEESKDESLSDDNDLKRGQWKQIAKDTMYIKRKIYIGCGKIKLFIGYSPSEKSIQDLYVVRSGNGGCEKNIQSSVIAMSGMLRLGGNLENIKKSFEGVGGCNSFVSARLKGQKLSKGSSCSTAILNTIEEFLKEIQDDNEIKKEILFENDSIKENEELTQEEKEYINSNGEIAFAMNYHKCPLCGSELVYSGGCLTCKDCGWSKCN